MTASLFHPDSPGIYPLQNGMTDGAVSPVNLGAFLAAAAILFIAWQAWSARPRVPEASPKATTIPPEDLHPAYAGALASGRISDAQIEAAVLEMVRRGAIALEPDSEQRDKVQIRLLDSDRTEGALERELYSSLERRSREGVIRYSSLSGFRKDLDSVRRTFQQEMANAGWLNPSIMKTRVPFLLPGIIGFALALTMLVSAILEGTGWPLLGAFVVGGVGLGVITIGGIVPQTTREGEHAAIPWRGFRAGLIQARDEAHGTLDLDRVFPFIVAMGMAASFDRYLRRASQSGYIPDWIGKRSRVQEWPEGWHTYWIALHTALAPTDPANTRAPSGSPWRRGLTGGSG